MTKERVLLISPLFPAIGGISVSVEKMRERLILDGYDVSAINIKFKNKRLNDKFFLFFKFAIIPFMIPFRKRYDIIHCHVSGGYRKFYLSLFKKLYKNASLIYTIHGDVGKLLNDKKSIKALNSADGVICVQQGDSIKLRKLLSDSVHLRDIPAFFVTKSNSNDTLPEYIQCFISSNASASLLVVSGKIVVSDKYYDLYGLLDAAKLFKRLKEKGIDVKMLMILIGEIASKDQLAIFNEIKQIVGSDSDFMISESIAAIDKVFSASKIYLRPTKTDGDSLSVREALSCGCNVVASNVSNRPDGTILYDGSLDNMVEKTISVLSESQAVDYCDVDYYNDLIAFYNEVVSK